MSQELKNKKVGQALRWSIISEISSKLIVLITNIVLARLLTPEAFVLLRLLLWSLHSLRFLLMPVFRNISYNTNLKMSTTLTPAPMLLFGQISYFHY